MTLTIFTLVLFIGIAALIISLITGLVFKAHKSWLISYLQNFCGSLFIFSGLVKAVDPLGTAFKMEQYFDEFYGTFSDSVFSFIAPLFPVFSEYSIGFSVFMIVLEMILGFMLLLGARNKFTAWSFLLIVIFFTKLTGFTFLTGYVPPDGNFFDFGSWGAYDASNMKVTDCGCFGDFIKLEPRTSFFKDIFLLIPALIFVFRTKMMHQLFTKSVRDISSILFGVIILIYCMSNYVWDIPHVDFRPFKESVSIREKKILEEDAAANVEVTAYKLQNKSTGEVIEIPLDQFLSEMANYPKEEWSYDQMKTEPAIPATKISEFLIQDPEGFENTDVVLDYEGKSIMLISYKMPAEVSKSTITVLDTFWRADTVLIEATNSLAIVQNIDRTEEREIEVDTYMWGEDYAADFKEMKSFLANASEEGLRVFMIAGGASPSKVKAFQEDLDFPYPVYLADDILLKTIIRSNPGIVLMEDGRILRKWHKNKLPEFEKIKALGLIN